MAIGSFKNKVAIFQEVDKEWKEVAYHYLHEASVNCVEWAQSGLKLYAAGGDGYVSIIELSGKTWKTSKFNASDHEIAYLAL